jgi:integrase
VIATVIQRKIGRPVQFEITEQAGVRSASAWPVRHPPGSILVPDPSSAADASLDAAVRPHRPSVVERACLDSSAYGTHSLRRTKAAQFYRKTGNLRAAQLLLGHTKLESTVRHLGIEVDDPFSISEQVEL